LPPPPKLPVSCSRTGRDRHRGGPPKSNPRTRGAPRGISRDDPPFLGLQAKQVIASLGITARRSTGPDPGPGALAAAVRRTTTWTLAEDQTRSSSSRTARWPRSTPTWDMEKRKARFPARKGAAGGRACVGPRDAPPTPGQAPKGPGLVELRRRRRSTLRTPRRRGETSPEFRREKHSARDRRGGWLAGTCSNRGTRTTGGGSRQLCEMAANLPDQQGTCGPTKLVLSKAGSSTRSR